VVLDELRRQLEQPVAASPRRQMNACDRKRDGSPGPTKRRLGSLVTAAFGTATVTVSLGRMAAKTLIEVVAT
jgi:hypothetical protein